MDKDRDPELFQIPVHGIATNEGETGFNAMPMLPRALQKGIIDLHPAAYPKISREISFSRVFLHLASINTEDHP